MYEVKVENIFEGPMDLLVFLIKKHEVDIYDIPIALITDQFLAYLEWMKAMNVDFAGDFMVMAATLTQIKSKMLLPVHDPKSEEDDPRLEVIRPLIEYLHMKSAADQLLEKNILGEDVFAREPAKDEFQIRREQEVVKIGLFELIDAFQSVLEKMPADHNVDFSDEKISIKDKMNELIEVLEKTGSSSFDSLFHPHAEKGEMIITFLAILEMAKLCLIRITQQVQTGIIRVFYL